MQGSIVCDMIEKMEKGRPGGEDVCGLIAIPEPRLYIGKKQNKNCFAIDFMNEKRNGDLHI